MQVRVAQNKQEWEDFLQKNEVNTFLQSWNWGVFNEKTGKEIFRLGLYEDGKLVGICLLIKEKFRFASALYSPRGPILDWDNQEAFQLLNAKTVEITKERNLDFIKFEPLLPESVENERLFRKLGFSRSINFIQAESVWILDLDKTEGELLVQMRKTTRYLVRNEEKQGARVEKTTSSEDIETFVELLNQTAGRKGFANHSKEYYKAQFETLAADDQMLAFKSTKDGEIQSMALVAYYGNSAYYLHGASKPGEGSVGYLVQWEAIKEAKRRGMKYYNFWGVAREDQFKPGHPWYGFSLFKMGFGGRRVEYLRAQDLAITSKYSLQRRAEHALHLFKKISPFHTSE